MTKNKVITILGTMN